MKAKVAQNMTDCFDWIERELLRGPWVMGKDFSVADPYLFTLTIWLMQNGVDLARFPRVADHYQRMLALPAVQKIAPLHNL
jgi:glutathione S-transferase